MKIDTLEYYLVPGKPLDTETRSEEVWDPEESK